VFLALAGPALAEPPLPVIPATNFNITSFGAFGDGVSNNASAIQNTINSAAAAGGGTVVVAAVGILTNYLSGPFNLTNNVSLQINSGTKLQMLPKSTWPNANAPFIYGTNLHDVAISGSGTIDGQGSTWWPGGDPRPYLVNVSGSTRVLVQNVTFQNSPMWHIVLIGNTNVTVQGITVNTPSPSPNTDGIDLGSTNCLIQNCSISGGDDNISIKSTGALSADIMVSNCTFGTGHGVSLGSDTSGGVQNMTVSNCTFNGTDYGIRMKSDRDRGGLVQNLKYMDITMTNVKYPIVIYSYYTSVGTPSGITPFQASTDLVHTVTSTTPIWRNITISNVTATATTGNNIAGIIWGLPEMLVSNVTLSKVNMAAPTKTFCIYAAQGIQIIDSNLTAPNTTTNTLTIYNADVTITNTTFTTNLVTLGGLAMPPANNVLTLFNTQVAITDTNMLGTGPITLGGSTLTFSQSSVNSFNNTIAVLAGSTLIFTGGVNAINGTLSGSGSVRGSVTVNGTLSPGASPGTLNFSDDLLLNGGAALQYDLGTNSDLTLVGGNLTLGGTLNINDAGGFTVGVYTLLTYGGALTDNGATIGTMPSTNFTCTIDTSTAGEVKLNVNHAPSTIFADVGNLADSFGNLAPAASVAVLVADTGNNGFTDPQSSFPLSLGATWGTDDKVVGLWNLMNAYPEFGDGQLLDQVVVAYTNGIAPGQRLQLYWFPSLTLASNTVGLTYYGKYTDTNNPTLDGSDAWQMPAGGMNLHLRFWTTFWGGSNPEMAGWATLLTTVPTPFESWQIQYFGDTSTPAAAASADPDGDGQNNLAEFLAGTDPTNSTSAFRITSIVQTNNDVVVTWTSGPGKTNALQKTAGAGDGSYQTNNFADIFVVTNTVGTVTNYLDVGAATNSPACYYQIRLVP
jgi:polygalacturonase